MSVHTPTYGHTTHHIHCWPALQRLYFSLRKIFPGARVELYTFDEAYVQRLRADDPVTQQHFVAYFSKLILIKLRARYLQQHIIEDVRQETFTRVLVILKREKGLEHPERLGAFVNSVCNNVLLEQFRSSTRAEGFEEGFDPPDKNIDMDRSLITEDAQKQVKQVLAQLPERDRQILKQVFLEERDKDQICRELGVDREYLRVLLHRAKSQFRSKFWESRSAIVV
jgi:RNA polymerase sigma-70 factor (ECF subfamily)